MTKIQLTCFAQSGNAYKAALMLNLCGVEWEPKFVDFFNGGSRTDEYLELNTMGEVPVLIDGEKTITQSGVILKYLSKKYNKFGGKTEDDDLEILRWLLWDNHKLTNNIAVLRYLLQFAKTGETEVIQFLRARIKPCLKVLNNHLDNSSFAIGAEPTIADISMCGYLYWPDEFGVSWADYPAIASWLDRIKALDGWVHPYELMPGHPLAK